MAFRVTYGTLLIPNKTGTSQLEYPIEKKSVLIGRFVAFVSRDGCLGLIRPYRPASESHSRTWVSFSHTLVRDKACDIRIVNKEVSRRHLELSVNEAGEVCVVSLGREPVLVNKQQVLAPRVLQTGDKIEVLLEGRTREFLFKASAMKKVERAETLGSPLVASSIANRRSGDAYVEDVAGRIKEAGGDMEPHVDAMEEDQAAPAVVQPENQPTTEPEIRPDDAISMAVSQLVQDILNRVVQSVDAASAILTPVPSSSKRKSVRFVTKNGTPEGVVRDTTMTIRCLPREDSQQAVLVEDNTMAISEWGFKTMQTNEECGEKTEATGVEGMEAMDAEASQDDRHHQLTPASIGDRVPPHDLHSKLGSPHVSSKLNFQALAGGTTSQGTPGVARAPATTPVTAAKPFMVSQKTGDEVDFAALARKLEEIAEEHDVQFELPKDFMRFTPVPSVSKSKRKSLGEVMSSRSAHGTGGANVACRRLSICSSKEGSMEYDLPKDFMRFTPLVKSALKNIEESMTAVGGIHESPEDGEEIATLRSVGHAVHNLADALEEVKSVGKSVQAKTPGGGVKITIVEKGSTFKTAHPEVKVVFDVPGDSTALKESGSKADTRTTAAAMEGKPSKKRKSVGETRLISNDGSDLIGRFNTALGQARAYRTQALVLGKHLKKSSAKLAKAHAVSKVLSIRYRAERAKRIELQNTIKRLIDAREAQEATLDDVDEMGNKTDIMHVGHTSEPERRVVVLGHTEPNRTHVEMAGEVAVVRQSFALQAAVTPAPVSKARPSSAAVAKSALKSSMKSAAKSVKRVSLGGDKVRVLVDDVELPMWMFDKDPEDEVVDHLEGVESVVDPKDGEDQETALKSLEKTLESPLPEDLLNEEEAGAEASADACFVCGVGDDGDVLLLCDSCDNACHLGCCKPARKTVPKGDWYCAECKAATKKRKALTATSSAKSTKASKENIIAKKTKVATERPAAKATRATRRSARN